MDYINLKPINNKTCPSCGAQFTCTGEDDCWCENYTILRKDMYRLAQSYVDCICPECLKGYETR
jgi:hypothetical protein